MEWTGQLSQKFKEWLWFTYYVDKILAFFDHLPPSAQWVRLLHKYIQKWFFIILAMFVTSSSKYSISQKLFFKLTSISPRKTQDNLQINIQKITQIWKCWAPSFSTQKRNVGSRLYGCINSRKRRVWMLFWYVLCENAGENKIFITSVCQKKTKGVCTMGSLEIP